MKDKEKNMGKKLRFSFLLGVLCVAGYAFGTHLSADAVDIGYYSHSFFYTFSQAFSLKGFSIGFFRFVFPLFFIFLNGFSYIGRVFSLAAVFISSFLSGYCISSVGGSLIREDPFLFVLYTLLQSFELLILISQAYDGSLFFRYISSSQRRQDKAVKVAVPFYMKRMFMRLGLSFFVYFLRSAVCSFF